MKKLTATVVACVAALALSAPAMAGGGKSEQAQTHPGHQGYLSSDEQGGGIPTGHFAAHGGPGYDSGPGGWGAAVSGAASACGGIPAAHSGC